MWISGCQGSATEHTLWPFEVKGLCLGEADKAALLLLVSIQCVLNQGSCKGGGVLFPVISRSDEAALCFNVPVWFPLYVSHAVVCVT